jgi:cell division protein FtsW (lipid II flippase)
VLLSWMAVALTELTVAQEQLGHEPFALLTAETRADRAPWIPVAVTATLGFAIAVTSVAPHVMMPLAVLVALIAGVKLVVERRAGRSGAGLTTVLAVTALVAVLGGLELVGKLQGPALLLGVVFMLFLLGVRAGVLCQKRISEEAYARLSDQNGQSAGVSKRSLLLALSLPFVALGLAAVFDFGLGLLMFLPIFLTVLLAAGWNRIGSRILSVVVVLLMLFLALTVPVLFPRTEQLARETRIDRRAQLFDRLGGPMAWFADASDRSRTAVRRAMIRSLAARDPALLEQLLPAVGPSEARDEIIPSIEQAWGGKAYSAAGWFGAGFAGTSVLGRGISSATSYAENTFAVYVLSEHGAIGGLTVLGLYAALAGVLIWWARHLSRLKSDVPRRAATLAVVVGGGLLLVLPAAYVALSNLGVVPLTGQNMPFLGLNAWSDVVFVAGIGSAMLMALTWLTETEERA